MKNFFREFLHTQQRELTFQNVWCIVFDSLKPQEYKKYELGAIKEAVRDRMGIIEGLRKPEIMALTNEINELGDDPTEWFAFARRERLLPEDFDIEAEAVRYYAAKNNIRIIEKIPKK
jgi:hypothetical protein